MHISDLLSFPKRKTKANSEYAEYVGKITDRLNEELIGTKFRKYTYGRIVKLLKGIPFLKVKDRYHYWDKRNKESGYPFGKGFIGQIKKEKNAK